MADNITESLDLDFQMLPSWAQESYKKPAGDSQETSETKTVSERHFESSSKGEPRHRSAHRKHASQGPKGQGGGQKGQGRQRSEGAKESSRYSPNKKQAREASDRVQSVDQILESLGLSILFIPEPKCVESVAQLIRQNRTASSLFAVAKLFLSKPERYQISLKTTKPNVFLYQCAETQAIALDAKYLESVAFDLCYPTYYKEEVIEREKISGNYTNVARCKLSGELLGPTNHHSYQRNMRLVFEQRFMSQMPFERYRKHVEILSDSESIERWKDSIRFDKTYTTLKEAQPITLKSSFDALQHFKLHYLNSVLSQKNQILLPGELGKAIPDIRIQQALRLSYDQEMRFPQHVGYALRRELSKHGLCTFKHGKKALYVSAIRPKVLAEHPASPQIVEILEAIQSAAACTRQELANQLLGSKNAGAPDHAEPINQEVASSTATLSAAEEKARGELAANLRWLIAEGYIIEFQDGKLALPQKQEPPDEKSKEPAHKRGRSANKGKKKAAQTNPE